MKLKNSLRWLNAIALAALLAVNALAELLPINGVTTAEVGDAYPNLFTPAPYTFGIWGAIYLLLIAFALYQSGLFGKRKPLPEAAAARIGAAFAVSCVFNIAWVFAWHYDLITLSLVCMAGLLISLAVAFRRIHSEPLAVKERLFVELPFALYFGWITVATIANVSVLLVALNWNGFGLPDTFWTVVVLALGLLIGLAVIFTSRSAGYGAALIWAYVGILVRHVGAEGFGGAYPLIAWLAGICVVLLFAATLLSFFRLKDKRE